MLLYYYVTLLIKNNIGIEFYKLHAYYLFCCYSTIFSFVLPYRLFQD